MTSAAGPLPNDDPPCRPPLDAIADHVVSMLDSNGTVVGWNPNPAPFQDYMTAEVIGSDFSRFYTPEDRAAGLPRRALEIAARDGRFEGEGRCVRPDGTPFRAQVAIDPIRGPAGELIGYATIIRDLTGRRRDEEALRQSEQRFRLLVQSVTDYAIYMLDPEGHVTSWNAGAQRIKGYTEAEILGGHFSRFYLPEDRAAGEPQRALRTAAEEGRFAAEGWRLRKDGTRFRASVVVDPILDTDGRIVGFAKVTRDITERVEVQRQLEEAREALFQSQKMEAIGQLTGGVAHDFNNLLAAVLGSLELLRARMPDQPRALSLLDNAISAARRGAALTQRMLAFARRQDLHMRAVDIERLLNGMLELLRRPLGSSVTIAVEVAPALPAVHADPNQLELALLNLAVNARDAMPDGGAIRITAREAPLPGAEGRFVCLAVEDTGTGMDAATLSRAIEPFFTTKGVGKGTGLGLSMVHGMLAQLGGRLTIRSQPGQGTVAEMWLPLAPEQVDAEPDTLPAANRAVTASSALTVLAVDDDPLVLTNMVAMLEDLGHRVLEAQSGPAALELLQGEAAVDLVITDQAMPVLTGAELAAAIRRDRPGMPIILATGYADLPPGAGADLYRLPKPFRLADLEQAIDQAMTGPSG